MSYEIKLDLKGLHKIPSHSTKTIYWVIFSVNRPDCKDDYMYSGLIKEFLADKRIATAIGVWTVHFMGQYDKNKMEESSMLSNSIGMNDMLVRLVEQFLWDEISKDSE